MLKEPTMILPSLIPDEPIPVGSHAFSKQVHGLMDGQPKDEATVAQALKGMDDVLDRIAAGLYNLASMLIGEGEASVRLVEATIATAEVSLCSDPVEARRNSRRALATGAINLLSWRDPQSLAAPESGSYAPSCIEDDDLKSAGLAQEELDRLIVGPERDRVREWLASLPTTLRTVFVLRAVAGLTAAETTSLLQTHGGAYATGWNREAVREVFRQGLCSLTSQLIHATAAR
jgi:hypothetical protein